MATSAQIKSFISTVAPMFQKYGSQYGFHINSFPIAQACLESGYGLSAAATSKNNILGIGPGKYYPSWDACVKGYYTDTVLGGMTSAKNATTLDAYYNAFIASGYCADPDGSYYRSVKSIISANNLTQYDNKSGGSTSRTTTASTNNKIAWDYLVGQKGWSKTAAAACIGCWLAENGYEYGATYAHVTPPYPSGTKNPYKYLTKELFPAEIEEYWSSRFPGNDVIMKNPPQSLKEYTWNYRPNGVYYSDGYCGIGIGSWTFVYGAGALLQYANKHNKKWDDLLLQLDFATYWYSSPSVEAIDGKTHTLDANRPTIYAKRSTNFSSVADATRWFIYYEMPSWYYSGYAPAKYISEAENVYKEFKDSAIGSVFAYTNDGSGGVVSDPNDVINAEAINGLIISIDPDVKAKDIDYDKMMSNHVSGVMFKAGAFYSESHKIYTYTKNTNLKSQINSAVQAGIRFGLFFDVRAKTIDEAKQECEQLYYTVSKYPPALGLWLHLCFAETSKKSNNNKIMDYYVKTMNGCGLSFGSGIYCTKAELERIDWDTYQENFFLWYVNRFTSESELGEVTRVLSPDFFVI